MMMMLLLDISYECFCFVLFTYFDIIADVARLSRSYPPSDPAMAGADQSVAADLPSRRCQVPTAVREFTRGSVSTGKL